MVNLVTYNTSRLLCIDLVILMDWVNSPELFLSALDNFAVKANAYTLYPISLFAIYPPTAKIYHTSTAPPVYPNQMQYINVYMAI